MKVLLINPNQFRKPPAPPIGLEFLAAHLEQGGHSVRMLDLCFSENIHADIDKVTEEFMPDLAGITIRNIDSVLYDDNEFFLERIRHIVLPKWMTSPRISNDYGRVFVQEPFWGRSIRIRGNVP